MENDAASRYWYDDVGSALRWALMIVAVILLSFGMSIGAAIAWAVA